MGEVIIDMSLPENKRVSNAEMWQLYQADDLEDFVSFDHAVIARKKSDGEIVWTEARN